MLLLTRSGSVCLASRAAGWSIVERRRKQKTLLIFGVKASSSLLEFKIACGDIGLQGRIQDWRGVGHTELQRRKFEINDIHDVLN